ncbi:hypothetical protein GWC77_26760 [Paraburkholderia sp. NMBU_R16]|uniref:hypothetical protein n=1 Tax=Paraburkholderia sp. NMBU_R16 TaxID=2698676 RepID=UPI00156623D6|nr:hypothetical protein [Paraburkholderia sp. NMBU_R16]NRO99482.1 hypothetical protein [Paraburkholderia sp. NMBU_R16]
MEKTNPSPVLLAGIGEREANAFITRSMPENADRQQREISTSNEHEFVAAIRDDAISANPKLGDDPTLLHRLADAYSDAKRMGLTRDVLLAEFLHLEAQIPGFYRKPVISKWLEKPGASIEDRFTDLLDVLLKEAERAQEVR